MADPSKPDKPAPDPERPSEWESDDPNEVSWKTGKRRKISVLRVPPDTLPTAKPDGPPEPPKERRHRSLVDDMVEDIKRTAYVSTPKQTKPEPAPESPPSQNPPPPKQEAESKPVDPSVGIPPVMHPNPSESYLRRDRISRAVQSGERPDPKDLADQWEEEERYKQELRAEFEQRARSVEPPPSYGRDLFGDSLRMRRQERLVARMEKLQQPPEKDAQNIPEPHTGTVQESSATKSRWDKFWKLTENNLLWGGGVGLALAAYAFLGGAPRFAAFLLICSWLVISVSVYRHKFFEGKKRRWEIVGNAGISLLIAVVLAGLWFLLRPSVSIPAPHVQPTQEENEVDGNVFLSEEHPAIGKTKTFSFLGDKNYGAVSFQARFGLSTNVTIIVLVHSINANPDMAAGDCLTAINNYQAIVDDLKAEVRKGRSEFIDLDVYPKLICHYDYATDIPPARSEALKRIASRKNLVLSIEGPRGAK